MDLVKVKRLRQSLTLHFAILAWLTAMLVAGGSGSIFLPVLIVLVGIVAYVYVDKLEWFEITRFASYFAMGGVTCISIVSYVYSAFNSSENGQFMAVAGMLVYPEAVLFLQRKNLRIYEQLAIFLLLEMVVAALVNDNILFGLLLAPIMLLWVSALFVYSRYATLVSIDPTIETPTPKLAEVLFKRLVKTVLGEGTKQSNVTSRLVASSDIQASPTPMRLLHSIPIGIGALTFAGLFFYLLPRTAPVSFQPTIGIQSTVGLPNTLTFGKIGRILQNPNPVMRVTLTDARDNTTYEVVEPPYLRALIFDAYGIAPRQGWNSRGEWFFASKPNYGDFKSVNDLSPIAEQSRDPVHIEFDIKRAFVSKMYSVPPVFAANNRQRIPLRYDPALMIIEDVDIKSPQLGKSLVYRIGSEGFLAGVQSPVTPAHFHGRNSDRQANVDENPVIAFLRRGFTGLVKANQYRLDLLARAGVDASDKVHVAIELEKHFIAPGNFTYSLDLDGPVDNDLDPIEDFLLNQRRGHCQYFASAMVALMRQSGIPSRIVVGYRPTQRNEIGNYFLVRQSDAHAWVEGLFSRDDLIGTDYEKWLTDHDHYWVRFDPTPASDGGELAIVRQQGQAMDYAEKLWKDYVVDAQKLAGENSLYAPVAENSKNAYDGLIEKWNTLKENIRAGRSWTDGLSIGIAWPLTFAAIVLAMLGLSLWRLAVILPRFAPRLALRLGLTNRESEVKQQFYERCLNLLESLGIRRQSFETPQEFTRSATDILSNKGLVAESSLSYLTAMYYRLRFSKNAETTLEEGRTIDVELQKIEDAISAARH